MKSGLRRRNAMRIALVLTLLGGASLASARGGRASSGGGGGDSDSLQEERRMVFLAGDGAMTTYKSKMVEQNDTGTQISYTLGATVGEEKDLEFRIRTDSSTIPFELNESSIASEWQDTLVIYHWPYLYIGAGLGSNAMTVTKAGEDFMDVVGTGFGGCFGVIYPISRSARVSIDAIYMGISEARELEQKTVAFGARTDFGLNVSYDLTKTYFDLVYGYRYRAYSVTIESEPFAELVTSTYLGLQFGFDL